VSELRPASEFELGQLARLFTAAYEGYYVPFAIDEATLRFMVDAYQLDLGASRVALRDGDPIGIANLGVRGDRGWIGGIGVVPAARRHGVARALMEAVLGEARRRGITAVSLEVLEQNEPAYRLYDELGFETTRWVDVWVLDRADGVSSARETDVDEAHARIRELRRGAEPWQRADETLAHARTLEPPPAGLVADGGAVVYRATPQAVSIVQIAGDERATQALLASLRTRGTVNLLNLPAGEPAASALRSLGGRIAARQREMALTL
jgi:ribosomal protein S18 acetylase RimI-like enzyme